MYIICMYAIPKPSLINSPSGNNLIPTMYIIE